MTCLCPPPTPSGTQRGDRAAECSEKSADHEHAVPALHPVLPLASCVTQGRFLNFSEPSSSSVK